MATNGQIRVSSLVRGFIACDVGWVYPGYEVCYKANCETWKPPSETNGNSRRQHGPNRMNFFHKPSKYYNGQLPTVRFRGHPLRLLIAEDSSR